MPSVPTYLHVPHVRDTIGAADDTVMKARLAMCASCKAILLICEVLHSIYSIPSLCLSQGDTKQ